MQWGRRSWLVDGREGICLTIQKIAVLTKVADDGNEDASIGKQRR